MIGRKFLTSISLCSALTLFGADSATAQSFVYDFEDGTDQGFGAGFGDDSTNDFTILNVAGSNRMVVPRTGAFQEAGNEIPDGDPAYAAFNAAFNDPDNYLISYDWYVDTSIGAPGTFLQIGTYINAGSGDFLQKFPDVELLEDDLLTGNVFSGTVSATVTDTYGSLAGTSFATDTFLRFGLILNGDGASSGAFFDNISVTKIPEPTSLALLGLALPAVLRTRRR